ncbi:glycosyl transferase [Micromonospora sonneratiae]
MEPGGTPADSAPLTRTPPEVPTRSLPGRTARWLREPRIRDAGAVLSFVVSALWVTLRLWRHPTHGLRSNLVDQAFFEWMLAHGARVVTEFAYPFVSYRMNAPSGVNMMANTSVLAVSIPMTPLTLVLGPRLTFNIFLTLALIATATTWYFVLSRHVVTSRAAAWLGALFCGFAPSMVSHANGHPNIVSQFLVPLIIWRTLRLRQAGRWGRNGLLLGLLVVWQAFINLEVLLMTAVGLGIFVAVTAVLRPELRRDLRPFLAGLGVAASVVLVLLAYPLYVQFFGPQSYHGLPGDIRRYGADLASFVAFSRESIAGDPATAQRLTQNPSEENAFFGWPLVVLVAALVLWMRRSATVVGLAAAGLVFALFSLGPAIRFDGRQTGVPGPWRLLGNLPVLDSAVPTRWAVAITPIVGILLALGGDRIARLARQHPAAAGQIRFAGVTVAVMALLPVAPTPLPSTRVPQTPEFVTSGAWRGYAEGDRTMVTLPLPTSTYPDPLRWSAETGLDLRLAGGYFLGPGTRPDGTGSRTALFTAPKRPTGTFLDTIRRTGRVPTITAQLRADAVEDLRFWRAGMVVLAPQRYDSALRRGMTRLIGIEPTRIGGVWVWDVRPIVG